MENDLRKEAESLLGSKFDASQLQDKSLDEIIHELKVHQIELELQNDELLKTQERLVASQQKYFELFDLAPVAYLMVDSSTRIHDVNLTAANLFKEEKGFLFNKKFDSFIHPEYQDEFYFFFTRLKKNALETVHESCMLVNDKQLFVRIACNIDTPNQYQENQLIRFTLIDITTEKLAIKEHQESDKRFRQFAALLPQVICELDGDFNILYINDYGKQIFGLNKTRKKNLFDFLDNENKKMVADAFHQMVHSPNLKDPGLQINFRNATDEIVTLFAYANFEVQDNKITTIRAIGIDLSERIKMEKQLSLLNDELNAQKNQLEDFNRILAEKVSEEVEKNRIKDNLMSLQARQAAMGEMVGHIAHQWKQPLNTLNLVVMDLQDAYTYNELTAEYLNRSVESAKNVIQHMSQTIDDFRNFFKPLKSKTRFDIKQQIETALSFIQATIEISGIRLENKITEEIKVIGYPNEFSQVVINIVNNAREALIEANLPNPTISILAFNENGHSHIIFRNNGNPMPPDVMPRIFEPYYSTKEDENGTGIGLYLVQTIITKNMNGEINVKNLEKGVEFEIILPLL